MRSSNKYKKLQQVKNIAFSLPFRVKNFKRTKWKQLQKKLLNLNRFKIYNILQSRHLYRRWKKIRFSFKNALRLKTSIFQLFQKNLNNKLFYRSLFVKKCTDLDFFSKALVQNEFRLDLLLWKLHLFESSYAARIAINNHLIYVNDKTVKGNFSLKKGDLVSFSKSCNLEKKLNNLVRYNYLLTFVEVDYYSNTIIILKSYFHLDMNDMCLLRYKMVDLTQLRRL